MSEQWEDKIYYASRRLREPLLRPVVRVFALFRFTPEAVAYLGIFFVVLSIYFLKESLEVSLCFLAVALLMDLLDGSLARYSGIESDSGKFVDVLVDNVIFTLFVAGLVWAGFLSGLVATLYVYFMLLAKVLIVFKRNIITGNRGDWLINPKVGAFPNVFVYLSYIIFAFQVFFGFNYYDLIFSAFSLLLALRAVLDYRFVKNFGSNKAV